ncbi:hypothetical protein RYA05_03450 [Pseudomonas syringae pv. actinidiae]|nr:hypothetical protein [Pseudomonas syringae pv. actinidiae]
MSQPPEHSQIQLEVAKSLFHEFQKSMNSEDSVARTGSYCEKFEYLENRLQRAWLAVASKLITLPSSSGLPAQESE